MALEEVDVNVAKAYKDYRNYKTDFVNMLDEVYMKSQKIRYINVKSIFTKWKSNYFWQIIVIIIFDVIFQDIRKSWLLWKNFNQKNKTGSE